MIMGILLFSVISIFEFDYLFLPLEFDFLTGDFLTDFFFGEFYLGDGGLNGERRFVSAFVDFCSLYSVILLVVSLNDSSYSSLNSMIIFS